MNYRPVSNLILILFVIFTVASIVSPSNEMESGMTGILFMNTAYAQSSNTSADNSTSQGPLPENNSTDVLAPVPEDDSTFLGIIGDALNPSQNQTQSTQNQIPNAIPEFGEVVTWVLAISVISIITISSRTRL